MAESAGNEEDGSATGTDRSTLEGAVAVVIQEAKDSTLDMAKAIAAKL